MNFFTRYKPPLSPVLRPVGKSRTRQEFSAECDINYIVARVGAGVVPLVPPEEGYVDLSQCPSDYQECLDKIHAADASFASLPSKIRDRFSNSPSRLLEFLLDEGNRAEAERLGLVKAREPVSPSPSGDKPTE